MNVLKVSAKSNPNSVAGALAGVIRDHGSAEVQAVGVVDEPVEDGVGVGGLADDGVPGRDR